MDRKKNVLSVVCILIAVLAVAAVFVSVPLGHAFASQPQIGCDSLGSPPSLVMPPQVSEWCSRSELIGSNTLEIGIDHQPAAAAYEQKNIEQLGNANEKHSSDQHDYGSQTSYNDAYTTRVERYERSRCLSLT